MEVNISKRKRCRPTLKEYLYVAYFIGHLRSLGVYETFETEVRKRRKFPPGATQLAYFLYEQLRLSRGDEVVYLIRSAFVWFCTEKGVKYWASIDHSIRPFFP